MDQSIILEGEKFISSKQAALLTDYAPDYIGQMCRLGKLRSKMIGRTWYVSEKSLLEHKAESDTKRKHHENEKTLPTETVTKVQHVISPTIDVTSPARDHSVEVRNFSPATSHDEPLASPSLSSATTEVVNEPQDPSSRITETKAEENSHLVQPVQPKQQDTTEKLNDLSKGIVTLLFIGLAFSGFNLLANYGPEVLKENALNNIASANESISSVSVNLDVINQLKSNLKESAYNFGSAALTFYGINSRENIIAQNASPESQEYESIEPKRGIVVAHLEEDSDKNQLKNTIARNFSDEVEINFEEENSGVITPVFSDGRGDEYVFMIVPVDSN